MITDISQLRQYEIDLIRLIASGRGNDDIAKALNIPLMTLKSQIARLHRILGTATRPGEQRVLGRVRITIWAYEHGLVEGRPSVPPELRDAFIGFCRSVVNDQPRGDLRQWAEKGLAAAGVDQSNRRRSKPTQRA